MLNRRILRVKAFKVLYACAENQDLSLKEALASLEASAQATRDLYLYMMAVIPALTAEAAKRVEAARTKFNPTREDLHPNLRFVNNSVSALLAEDPDFQRLLEKKKFSWEQQDAFLNGLYETLKTRDYYAAYMDGGMTDAQLWKEIFANEFDDNDALAAILEDASIFWADELTYVINVCLGSLEEIERKGRWTYPPLYQSDILAARGKEVDSDSDFVRKLITVTYGRLAEYSALIASSVNKWEQDRLYTTDIVLISMGLAEAEAFPEIPVKVSINEYVEISKYYSTPKSHGFVNGLLDRLIKEKMAQGQINKSL
ncbi:MAG: transcription antitermination protein NusB [Bacteroidales bacterium]|nr:transcription antitermination protein NusB [Bacteroidales bacterium]